MNTRRFIVLPSLERISALNESIGALWLDAVGLITETSAVVLLEIVLCAGAVVCGRSAGADKDAASLIKARLWTSTSFAKREVTSMHANVAD